MNNSDIPRIYYPIAFFQLIQILSHASGYVLKGPRVVRGRLATYSFDMTKQRKIKLFFLIFAIMLIPSRLLASGCELAISSQDKQIELAPFARYITEDTSRLTATEVYDNLENFEWRETDTLNFGYSNSIYWVFICIENREGNPLFKLLEIEYPVLDFIDIEEYENGEHARSIKLGDKYSFDRRLVPHPNYIVPLQFISNERKTLLIRVETSSSVQIPAVLWDKETKLSHDVKVMIGWGLYYGAMLIMIIYNFLILVTIRDINYVFYVNTPDSFMPL